MRARFPTRPVLRWVASCIAVAEIALGLDDPRFGSLGLAAVSVFWAVTAWRAAVVVGDNGVEHRSLTARRFWHWDAIAGFDDAELFLVNGESALLPAVRDKARMSALLSERLGPPGRRTWSSMEKSVGDDG